MQNLKKHMGMQFIERKTKHTIKRDLTMKITRIEDTINKDLNTWRRKKEEEEKYFKGFDSVIQYTCWLTKFLFCKG